MQFDVYGEKPGHQEGQEACSSGAICKYSTTSQEDKPLKKTKIEIDVDDTDSTQVEDSEDQHWLQYKGCLLTQQDRTVITSNNLLSDGHINYTQAILHQQFPLVGGLKNTFLQGRP